ncbi:MAG: matrixin family metalloprotease [Archangiaceae bacterium]|nr:matrixin family metalloprotease [Archangiaceae bacterium]
MKHAVVVALLAAAACGPSQPAVTAQVVHEPCGPLVFTAPSKATEVQRDAASKARELWNVLGFTQLRADGEGEPIALRFQLAAAVFHGLYEPETGEVIINSGMSKPDEVAIVMAHELGHAMGLPHVTGRVSVMNPGNLTQPPLPEDSAQLQLRCP